ncbi:MAG: hypothetical protein JXA37_11160 [Chloroflexia bacterium]|nr:hypothetical protein [Chloroflexia bacterium]
MNPLLLLVGLPLALVLPGWSTLALLVPGRRLDALERGYLVLACSMLLNGWLALLLAQLGVFSAGLLLALLALYSTALGGLAWRRRRKGQTGPEIAPPGEAAPRRPAWEAPAFMLVTALFVLLAFRPFELVLGPRDAAVYPATGAHIASHGSIEDRDPLVRSLNRAPEAVQETLRSYFFLYQHPERLYHEWARMPGFFISDVQDGTVVPQFYNLYPSWLAVGFALLGLEAGLLVTPYLSLLGGMGLFMLARRLGGSRVALLAYLLLALNTLQVWFARYSTSEGATQFLTWLALYALLALEERRQGPGADFLGLLLGSALGLLALVRVDFFFTWAMLLPWLAYLLVKRGWRRSHRLMLLCLGLLSLHGFVQFLTLTRAYTLNSYYHRIQDWALLSWLVQPFLTPTLRASFGWRTDIMQRPWRLLGEIAVLLLLAGGLLLLRGRPAWVERAEAWLQRRRRPLLGAAALLLLLLAAYAYLVRPGILSWEVLSQPLQHRLALEGYIGAPVPEGRAANLVRLGWYFSPLGIALALLGIGALVYRARRPWASLLLVGLFYTAFFTYEVFGEPHHVYIMRRYVPVVLPFFCLAIAYALDWLARRRRPARPAQFLAGGLAALLLLYLAYTGRPFFQHREYEGALEQVSTLAERFEPDDVILLANYARDAPFTLATPLYYLYDRPALVLVHLKPDGALVEEQIARWQSEGRQVYLMLGNGGGRLFLPHTRLQWLDRFELVVPEFEQLTAQKPHNSYLLHQPFGLYRPETWRGEGSVLGELPLALDFGRGGYAYQVGGFYQDEVGADGASYCWTDGQGVLRLPWPEDAQELTITLRLAGGRRPAELGPARLNLCLDPERCLVSWTLAPSFTVHSVTLPAGQVPRQPGQTALLLLRSEAWRQVDYGLGGDARPLGVQVDWVELKGR